MTMAEETRRRIMLLRDQGRGIRWIARHLEISRNTVRTILNPDRTRSTTGASRRDRASLLEPYKPHLERLLSEDEERLKASRSAKPLTTTHLLKEIRRLGYRGGRTILDDYLRTQRDPRRRRRKAYCRFETAPAEESQQDWSPYRLELGGKSVVIQLFSLILCWSRYQFLRAYLDLRRPTLQWGHVAAFRYFQGVPWKVLYDRQSTITPFDIGGKPVIHEEYATFAKHYGFEVATCAPRDAERKGKVERPFQLFETSFLPRRRFESLEDLNRQIQSWLDGVEFPDEGNLRRHGTTGEVPRERWLEERPYLIELPPTDLLPWHIEKRRVHKDATISVEGTRYSVPARLVEERSREVWVAIGAEEFVVRDSKGQEAARHRIRREQKLVIDEEHYKDIRRRKRQTRLPELERQLLERFPQAGAFLDELKRTVRSIAPIHLREIIALTRRYAREEVEGALRRALADGTATAGYVRQLLERNHPTGHLAGAVGEIPKGLAIGPVDPGSPESYRTLFPSEENDTERQEEKR